MYKIQYFFFLICLGVIFDAQASLDSTLQVSYIDKKNLNQNLLSPTFSMKEEIKSYGFVDLKYQISSGGLRKAQDSYNYKSPEFYTAGYATLSKFRVAAKFSFNKIFEDSLAFGQRNNLDDLASVYAYAAKSMEYERQNYSANTSIRYDFHPKISASVNLDYLKHWSVGRSDPRLKTDYFQLKVSPGFHLNLDDHSLGIQGTFGQGDEIYSLQYKNREYQTSLLYPDRIHYMNYGYGSSVIKDSSSIEKYENVLGAKLHYELRNGKQKFRLYGEYENREIESFNQKRTSSQNLGPIAILYSNDYKFGASWLSQKEFTEHLSFGDLEYRNVYDGNLKTAGSLNVVNYEATQLNSQLGYLYKKKKNLSNFWEAGALISYSMGERIDRSSSLWFDYSFVKTEIPFQYAFKHRDQNWMLGAKAIWKMPLQQELTYNSLALTDFIKNIAFTDYYYEQLQQFGFSLHAENIRWSWNNDKQKLAVFGIFQLLKSNEAELESSIPLYKELGNTKTHFTLGLRLYMLNP